MVESSPSTDTAIAGFVQTAGEALAVAFGVDFRFWEVGEHSVRPCNVVRHAPVCQEATGAADARELETRLAEAEEPLLVPQPDGRLLVGLPLGETAGRRLAATATLDGSSRELMLRLARLVLDDLRLRQELDRCRDDLDVCAEQIGADFEELTFLRSLAEHLDVSDPSHGAWYVAEMILPLLASIIRAESLVLVAAGRDAAAGGRLVVDRPVVWVGPRRLDDEACRRFIERFREAAAVQPVVRNRFDETDDGREFPGVRKFIVTSMAKGDRLVGWLAAINHLHRPSPSGQETLWALSQFEFGSIEASLLSSVASMLATHARNVELLREKETLLINVVRAMVSAIDAKDPYTCGHSERVALVARRLGEELGLEEIECEQLYLSALMHDLGKLGVPDAVLRKAGPLTDEERRQLEPHPEQGWAILQRVEQLHSLLAGVLHHHERYDGRGYPDGLAGGQIPLAARILAVADSYDAMVSDRPYRQGMPEPKVEQILRDGAGTQWDPEVIEAFFAALPEIRVLLRAYQPQAPKPRRSTAASQHGTRQERAP